MEEKKELIKTRQSLLGLLMKPGSENNDPGPLEQARKAQTRPGGGGGGNQCPGKSRMVQVSQVEVSGPGAGTSSRKSSRPHVDRRCPVCRVPGVALTAHGAAGSVVHFHAAPSRARDRARPL